MFLMSFQHPPHSMLLTAAFVLSGRKPNTTGYTSITEPHKLRGHYALFVSNTLFIMLWLSLWKHANIFYACQIGKRQLRIRNDTSSTAWKSDERFTCPSNDTTQAPEISPNSPCARTRFDFGSVQPSKEVWYAEGAKRTPNTDMLQSKRLRIVNLFESLFICTTLFSYFKSHILRSAKALMPLFSHVRSTASINVSLSKLETKADREILTNITMYIIF